MNVFMDLRQPIALLIFSILCTSCMRIGPEFERPEVAIQEEWCGMEATTIEDSCWWHSLGDPVLDGLICKMMDQNLSLQMAAVKIQAAKAELAIAHGFLYPQKQQLSGSYISNRFSKNAPPISTLPDEFQPLVPTSNQLYSSDLEVIWELDIWGRFRKGVDAATARLCATVFDQHDVVVVLLAEVADAYLSLREAQELFRVIENNLEIQKRSLDIATVRYRNGLVSELDVHQAATILSQTRAEAEQTQKGMLKARNALAVLLSLPPNELPCDLCEWGDIPEAPECLAIGLPCDLLRRRPDLRALEMQAYAQSERIGIVKTDMLPHFRLFGSFGLQSDDFGKWFEKGSTAAKAGPGFQWDIFHYGRLLNAVRVEDARFQALVLNYQQAVLQAQASVEDAIGEFCYSHQQRIHLAEGTTSAKRAVELVQLQYREGIIDFTPLLIAEESQLQLERLYVRSRAEIAKALVRIYRGMGGGWEAWKGDHLSEKTKFQMECRTNWGSMLNFEIEGCSFVSRCQGEEIGDE